MSRSPRSVWVEICYVFVKKKLHFSHAPHGACELKFFIVFSVVFVGVVTLPTERVSWNENVKRIKAVKLGHAPHGACELKFWPFFVYSLYTVSRSPRSVWVEISAVVFVIVDFFVTLPTERVSWNFDRFLFIVCIQCHAPHGACELKWCKKEENVSKKGHAPHGACELKF